MSLTGSEGLPKTARLRKRAQFQELSHTGSKFHSANFVVIKKSNVGRESRLGITVSAKVGNAVVRNRIKRQIREFFRRHRSQLPKAGDFLVVARSSAADLPTAHMIEELEYAFKARRSERKS